MGAIRSDDVSVSMQVGLNLGEGASWTPEIEESFIQTVAETANVSPEDVIIIGTPTVNADGFVNIDFEVSITTEGTSPAQSALNGQEIASSLSLAFQPNSISSAASVRLYSVSAWNDDLAAAFISVVEDRVSSDSGVDVDDIHVSFTNTPSVNHHGGYVDVDYEVTIDSDALEDFSQGEQFDDLGELIDNSLDSFFEETGPVANPTSSFIQAINEEAECGEESCVESASVTVQPAHTVTGGPGSTASFVDYMNKTNWAIAAGALIGISAMALVLRGKKKKKKAHSFSESPPNSFLSQKPATANVGRMQSFASTNVSSNAPWENEQVLADGDIDI